MVMTGGNGPGLGVGPGWRWHVALSFAGAQRGYVRQVAGALQARGVRCFYDADEEIELWGKSLTEVLPAIYSEQAAAVVVFVSAEYAERDWTRLERRAALARAARERREYMLPARFDDTRLPGLLPDVSYVDLRTKTPEQFAAMIEAKLTALGIAPSAPPGDAGDSTQTVRTPPSGPPSHLARTLTGHTSAVLGVAFSPDGRLLATAPGREWAVWLWDPATGEHLRTLDSPRSSFYSVYSVYAVAFSPDGRLLAAADHSGAVWLWDPATGEHLRTLDSFGFGTGAVAFSPDGRLLATASYDREAWLWDPATGEHLRTLTGHTGAVYRVAFSPDGRLLATAGDDGAVWLWDPATGEHLRTSTCIPER